jgi:hypothetical protein
MDVYPSPKGRTAHPRRTPHASLGPGIPDPLSERNPLASTGHRLPEHARVIATPILGAMNIA